MPIGDRPVLDIVIRQLRAAGFDRITIATGYLAELIEAFFGDGRSYGVPIDYFREHEPLGTVGALALIDGLDEPFLVMNGDVLTDMDYAALLEHHLASEAAVTVAATRRHVNISLGVMEFDDPARPRAAHALRREADALLRGVDGRLLLRPAGARAHRARRAARLPRPDPAAARAGERVEAWRPEAYWLDLGRHDDYERAIDEFEAMRRPPAAGRGSACSLTRARARRRRHRVDAAGSWCEESGSARWRSAAASAAGSEPGAASGASSVQRVQHGVAGRLDAAAASSSRTRRRSPPLSNSTGNAKCELRATSASVHISVSAGVPASASR